VLTSDSSHHFDTIIVGAGSTGCVLAARLTEHGARRVLLVEAGRDYGALISYPPALQRSYTMAASLPGDPHGWSYMGQLTPGLAYPITRGKVVGGSSAVNGGQFTRGTPADFADWARMGNDAWTFEKVLPHFLKLEADRDFPDSKWHNGAGLVPVVRAVPSDLTPVASSFIDACQHLGYDWDADMNSPESSGVGMTPFNVVNGVRQNVGATYLDPAKRHENLRILDQSLVTRVLFEGATATGIEILSHNGTDRYYGDEIILTAGGLNSPQLLLLSGIGPSRDLKRLGIAVVQDSPGVGVDFSDHPAVQVSFHSKFKPRIDGNKPSSQVSLNFSSGNGSAIDDMRIFPNSYPKAGMLFGMRGSSARDRARSISLLTRPIRTAKALHGMSVSALMHDIKHRSELSFYCGINLPDSRGLLRLVSADPTVPPALDYNYLSSSSDLGRMREGVRLACDILRDKAFRDLEIAITGPTDVDAASDSDLNAWLRAHIGTAYHTAATCHMGPDSDETAVVDQYGRVRGVERLRVLDMSIWPQSIRRGPNASAIMMGERSAEFLQK
jgi:choline dehydrogenase